MKVRSRPSRRSSRRCTADRNVRTAPRGAHPPGSALGGLRTTASRAPAATTPFRICRCSNAESGRDENDNLGDHEGGTRAAADPPSAAASARTARPGGSHFSHPAAPPAQPKTKVSSDMRHGHRQEAAAAR